MPPNTPDLGNMFVNTMYLDTLSGNNGWNSVITEINTDRTILTVENNPTLTNAIAANDRLFISWSYNPTGTNSDNTGNFESEYVVASTTSTTITFTTALDETEVLQAFTLSGGKYSQKEDGVKYITKVFKLGNVISVNGPIKFMGDVPSNANATSFSATGNIELGDSNSDIINIQGITTVTTAEGTVHMGDGTHSLKVTGITNLNDTTESTNDSTGSLIVDGGVGIKKRLNVTGALDVTGDTSVSTFDSTGATSIATSGATVNINEAGSATTVKGSLTLDQTLDVTGITNLNNDTESTNDSTGSLIVDGGVGIKKRLNVTGASAMASTLDVTGVSTFNNTTIIQPTPDLTNSQKIQVVGGNGAQKYSNDGTQPAADGDNMWSIALEGEGNSAALEVWYDNKKVASFKPNV